MSFETISLLLNWLEMGALLAILFRLSSTFELIANTQRQLRRAIHHLGERRAAELGIDNLFDEPAITSVSRRCPHVRQDQECDRLRRSGPPVPVTRAARALRGRPGSLAAVFRLQFGFAFVGPDRLARFDGLVHPWLRSGWICPFLAGIFIGGYRLYRVCYLIGLPTQSAPRRQNRRRNAPIGIWRRNRYPSVWRNRNLYQRTFSASVISRRRARWSAYSRRRAVRDSVSGAGQSSSHGAAQA